ncbi:MAG: hypothetical protein ACO1NY_06710 [Pseudorhodoplanes sp.]
MVVLLVGAPEGVFHETGMPRSNERSDFRRVQMSQGIGAELGAYMRDVPGSRKPRAMQAARSGHAATRSKSTRAIRVFFQIFAMVHETFVK